MDEDFPVRIFENDPNVYISVYNRGQRWYYYNPDVPSLGAGAMGNVFLGYDYDTNQKVAIKQLFDKYANVKSVRDRSKLESSLAYSHPNIVEMLGNCMYEDEEGFWHVWVVSNFVEGKNLDKYIAGECEQMTPDERIKKISDIICTVLDALDYLHSKGVIHRDIKPSNIMVDKSGQPKLMDLGIARVTSANSYTSTGFVGTPLYASPEQVLRDKTQVQATPASDIYSLGMTFYVLINGDHPFDSPTESQILINQVTKKLPVTDKLTKRYKKLMSVIWKATDKDPGARYQTAMDFKFAIQNAMMPDRTPWWYWLAGVCVAALIAVVVFYFVNV